MGSGEMLALHLCMSKRHSCQIASPDDPLFLLLADIAARHKVPIDHHMEAVSITDARGAVCHLSTGVITFEILFSLSTYPFLY